MCAVETSFTVVNEEAEIRRLAEKLGYLTEDQVAMLAKSKVSTVQAWRMRGKGPLYVHFGNAFFYEASDVVEYLRGIKKTRSRESMTIPVGVEG